MAVTLEQISKEVEEKFKSVLGIPGVQEAIDRSKPAVTVGAAALAYVFNGYDTVTLNYVGLPFTFPYGEVTKVDAMPNYREAEKGAGRDEQLTYKDIPLKGEFIARELIDMRGYDKFGMKVFLAPPTDAEKKECFELGQAHIFQQMEEFKLGRMERRAGRMGRKLKADPRMFEWFKKYAPDDEMFAEDRKAFDSNNLIASAIDKMTAMMEQQTAIKTPGMIPPKKKPFQSREQYAAILDEWKNNLLSQVEEKEPA